jgi:CheY-like chemotaxis protein
MQLPHTRTANDASHTVLIIDPDPMNGEILQTILQYSGFKTLLATGAEEGIRLARWRSPSVIVTELFHRTENGWEVPERLAGDEETAGIPILAFTAHAMPADRDAALRSGVTRFVSKPTPPNELQSMVEELLWGPAIPDGDSP